MQIFFSTEFCFLLLHKTLTNSDIRSVGSHNQHKEFLHIFMKILTPEAAWAEIIKKNFTSPESVLPLPSFDQSLQHLPQQAFWRWSIQNLPWARRNCTVSVSPSLQKQPSLCSLASTQTPSQELHQTRAGSRTPPPVWTEVAQPETTKKERGGGKKEISCNAFKMQQLQTSRLLNMAKGREREGA